MSPEFSLFGLHSNETITMLNILKQFLFIGCIIMAVHAETQHPIHIQADKMVAHPQKQYVVFEGHVKVAQDNILLTSNALNVYYDPTSQSASMTKESVHKILATGNVIIKWKDYRIEAETAHYKPSEDILIISGDKVRLKQGKNIIAGSMITLNLVTEEVEISSNSGEQVEAIYELSNQDMQKK